MGHLDREQQLFVQKQICNWVFGLYSCFETMNLVWSAHGAEAYFWN